MLFRSRGPMEIGFISGGSGIAGMSNLSKDYLNYIIKNLSELDTIADIILVDTGAGIADAVLEFLVASGEILLVTTPEPASITDSYSLLKALNRHPRFSNEDTQVKIIANKVESPNEGNMLFNKLNSVVNRYLKIPIVYLGAIPQDSQLTRAVMQQMPVCIQAPASKSSAAYEMIAAGLLNPEKSKNVPKRGMTAFFSHIITGKR